jgi:hypothetical protein
MKKFKYIFFVISSTDYEKISEGKEIKEFLPTTSPHFIVLRHNEELRYWFRADTINDLGFFREKFKSIPYKWGETRDKLQNKE